MASVAGLAGRNVVGSPPLGETSPLGELSPLFHSCRGAPSDCGAGDPAHDHRGNPMNTSEMHQETLRARHTPGSRRGTAAQNRKPARQRPWRLAPRRFALHGAGAVAVAVCSVALASACSSPAPSRHVAAPPPSIVTAAPQKTSGPSNPAPATGVSSSPASGSDRTAPPAGPSVPRCKNLDFASLGVVSSHTLDLELYNHGNKPCSVYGYPGLALLDASHQALRSRTHWGSTSFARDPGPSLIVLSHGQAARAFISFTGHGTPFATYLEITPPNTYGHVLTSLPGLMEDGPGPKGVSGDLTVTAMTRVTNHCGC